jgi:hypothetical protein
MQRCEFSVSSQIKVTEAADVAFWTDALGVDEETLLSAVGAVGASPDTVQQYLAGFPSPGCSRYRPA